MVTFTQIPDNNTPLGGAVVYAFACDTPQTVDLRVTEAESGTLLGVRRFVEAAAAECDIAPMLRRALRFTPATGSTGVRPATERQVTARVELRAEAEEEVLATAPDRTFPGCRTAPAGPTILTTMPENRLIAPDESDELLLFTDAAETVTVTERNHTILVVRRYPIPEAGLWLFRLDMHDFPTAESVTVDAGPCGTVRYTVATVPDGAVRLAWRSGEGSVEQCTFPAVRSASVAAEKERVCGPDGLAGAAAELERRELLVSAFEPAEVLEALGEVLATPDVWRAADGEYEGVDVLTEEAVVRRYGTLSTLELEIRPKHKNRMPWN